MDRGLLGRATEGTDAPTPGYLYVDLAKAATANPTACQEMATYLTRKLQSKQNPNVKTKCCKVICKLAEQVPRNQFRRCVAQDSQAVSAIKEAINFRGPMDPVQGDAKNERVRAAAREALDAVYAEAPSSDATAGGGAMPMQAMSASYGSSPHATGYGGGGGGMGGGPRRMEGIGNPNYTDPRNDPRYNGSQPASFQDTMREAGEVLKGMIQDPLARNVGTHHAASVPNQGHSGNLPGYGGGGGASSSYGRPPPGASELSRQTGGQWTMASNRGPGAVTNTNHGAPATSEYYKERDTGFNSWNNGSGTSATAGVPGGSWGGASSVAGQAREPAYGTPSVTIHSAPGVAAATTTVGASSDGTFEKNLILELCPPGGVKPVPPPDKLANFARSVSNLNSELVCPVLLDFLEEGQPWIIRAKALCVMETAIQNGVTVADGTNPYKTFFHTCSHEIAPLATHPRAAISAPAKRVLLLLGITPGPAAAAAPGAPAAPAVAAAAVEAPNLLDFGSDEPAQPPPSQPAQPPPPPPTEAPPPPPPTAAAAAPAAPAGGGASMFGGMTVKGSTPAPAAPAPAAPPAPPAAAPAASLLDFNDPFAPKPEAVAPAKTDGPAAATTTSMFGDLSVKEEKKKEDEPAAASADVASVGAAAATSGSAFGFINNSSSSSQATAAATATTTSQEAPAAAPVEPKASFDPLQGGAANPAAASPTGHAKTPLSLSTEQMQAMAYQQMMMQQAQQMQQMQMAAMMAQQQTMAARGGSFSAAVPPPMPLQFRQSSGNMPAPTAAMAAATSSGGGGPTFHMAKKDDKKFDFVKDAMVSAEKKK